ncbi:MAG: hypothetical protein MUE72_12760 [Chitinophagaceae bacterium]|jgi:hypothetical protein|nr:hypothetical protein [Chitinophagaceae bacterium]
MKKLSSLFLLLFVVIVAHAQTVEEVVGRFIEAHGGKEKLSSINSIQVESALNLEQMGITITIKNIREKNKLFRVQSSSPMGGEESFTVVTDTAGYSFTPAFNSPMGSSEASLTKFTEAELTAIAYQKDCEGYFAQLVDYETKGSKATLIGKDKVNGTECDKVKLTLKTGQEMVYFISQANGQVRRLQVAAPVAMEMMGMSSMMKAFGGSSRMGERKIDIDYEKYKIFDGIPFPTKQSIQLGPMALVVENTSFKINQPIDAKWYLVK